MCLIGEMLQKAFEHGELTAQRAHEMNVPDNFALALNPYKGFGKNSEMSWENGFHYRKMRLSLEPDQ